MLIFVLIGHWLTVVDGKIVGIAVGAVVGVVVIVAIIVILLLLKRRKSYVHGYYVS